MRKYIMFITEVPSYLNDKLIKFVKYKISYETVNNYHIKQKNKPTIKINKQFENQLFITGDIRKGG